jgi:hypothetical protein
MNGATTEPLRCQCSEQGLHRIADEIWWRTKLRPTCEEVSQLLTTVLVRQAKEQREAH